MKILKLWYSIIGLHALHQIEESISFFHWELAHVGKIPDWLLFNLKLLDVVGDYQQQNFFVSSFFQILITSTIAFAFRKNLKITKILIRQILWQLGTTCLLDCSRSAANSQAIKK